MGLSQEAKGDERVKSFWGSPRVVMNPYYTRHTHLQRLHHLIDDLGLQQRLVALRTRRPTSIIKTRCCRFLCLVQ
jgi:hypothetical protein